MNRSDYAFSDLTMPQYEAIVLDGTMAGYNSPMHGKVNYDALMKESQATNIDPRIGLAWCWSEGHFGSDPGLVAATYLNFGGIKWANQPNAYDTGLAADTGGTYAGFHDMGGYFHELYRTLTNEYCGPYFESGDLYGCARKYTNWDNPQAGRNKVDQYVTYRQAYPPAGAPVVLPGVYGEDIVAALLPHLGEANSDNSLDPWNRAAYPNHPWPGFCEASTEGAQYAAGLTNVVHRLSAALKLDAVVAQGLLQTSWPPEDGGVCLWGRSFDPQGHTAVWSAARGAWISTLYPPNRGLDYYYTDAWKAAMAGWYRAPGVVGANRTIPVPVPPAQMPFFVDGNPWGPIPVRDPFWARWDQANTLGQKLDHPGAVNPQGLALPQIGYPVEPERTLATGRRVQKFERVYLAINRGAPPFDVVALLLSEIGATQ